MAQPQMADKVSVCEGEEMMTMREKRKCRTMKSVDMKGGRREDGCR